MTPVRYIRGVWERRWGRREPMEFDDAGSIDVLRALQLFEPHVIDQALSAGPRLGDALSAARWIQGLSRRPHVPLRVRGVACRPAGTGARWFRPRSAPLRPSHRRVVIRT